MSTTPHGLPTGVEGKFAHIGGFTDADAATHSDAALTDLANRMMLTLDPNDPKDGADDEENLFVPAGYTYFGQFVDHDLTFDTISNFNDAGSAARAADQRTPRFDLDNVYGRGPDDQPYMYAEHGQLLLGDSLDNHVPDVARNAFGRAIIGDPRNDENSIVVQLQAAMILFHNHMINRALDGDGTPPLGGSQAFDWARRRVQHHYQRLILDDYLPRIVDPESTSVKPIFDALRAGAKPTLRLFGQGRGAYMPLEFSVAAYRFGHSMIRPGYRLATEAAGGTKKLISIFKGVTGGLRGFQRLARDRGIDWHLFFHKGLVAGEALSGAALAANNADGNARSRTQFAYKIDTMLVDPIGHLPPAVASNPSNLAARNMLRGKLFHLPSGQTVARALNIPIVDDNKLSVRVGDAFDNRLALSKINPEFAGNAPLWFYTLAEAEQQVIEAYAADPKVDPKTLGTRLTGVGAAIVVETFVGLMLADPDSVLNVNNGVFTSINGAPSFSMRELLTDIGAF